MELNIAEKRAVVENAIKQVSAQLYDLEIGYSVNKKIDDKEGMERLKKSMEITTKRLNEYEVILKALDDLVGKPDLSNK